MFFKYLFFLFEFVIYQISFFNLLLRGCSKTLVELVGYNPFSVANYRTCKCGCANRPFASNSDIFWHFHTEKENAHLMVNFLKEGSLYKTHYKERTGRFV